jgi:excisionase family DNA binding protein
MDILKLVSVKIAAEELGVAEVTLRKWIGQRKLAIVRIGRKVKIPVRELERLVEQGAVPATAEHAR